VVNSISWIGDAEGDGDLEVMTGEYYAGFLWGFNVPPSAPLPTEQTFTIFGGNGNVGDIDPYTQALPEGATVWQQAYLTGGHPWGVIPGTDSWVNFDPNNTVGINTRTPYRIRFVVPADFSNPSMVFNLKADNRALIWINDTFIDSVDGQGSPAVDATIASQALHVGVNEIRIMLVDWGGIVGLNYRVDVTMTSVEDITNAVLTPDEAAALNYPPVADAGANQSITVAPATLDGSGSSDPDGNLLTYSWSENGSEIATGINPTVSLVDGSHTITLTVSDGELSATDEVLVVVSINQAPIAVAGADQTIDCAIGNVDVSLNGSGSSDPDGDALSYSWSLNGSVVSTSAAFMASLSAGSYEYTLAVDDGNGGGASSVVSITVIADTEAPVITLAGDNPLSLSLYTTYGEPGYSAEDACDPTAAVVVTGTIDINTPDTYTLTYTATDASGNNSTAERQVVVVNTPPEIVNGIGSFELLYGDDVTEWSVDLTTVFADADTSDVLSYSLSNSNSGAVTLDLTETVLGFSAADLGEAQISITATDPWAATITETITVTVSVTPEMAGALLYAQEEIKLKKDIDILSGNVLVNTAHENEQGHGHDHGHENHGHHDHFELKIDKDVVIAAGYEVVANTIQIKRDATIGSDVYSNDLDNRGTITGQTINGVDTPLFLTQPPFKSAPAGTQNITVHKNQDLVLEPGDYGRIKIEDRATLTLTGGIYNIRKLETKKRTRVRFENAAEVRVEDKIKISKKSYVGPAEGALITGADIIFYIASNEQEHSEHHAAKLEDHVIFYGTIYAQYGEVELKKNNSFTGAILAEEIDIDKESDLSMDSYFAPQSSGVYKLGRTAWVEPEIQVEVPEVSALTGNYPNPFNPSTTIDFALSQDGPMSLKVYDIRGAQVAKLAQGYHDAGNYSVSFSGEGLSSGTYFYVLEAGSFRQVKRMIYLK